MVNQMDVVITQVNELKENILKLANKINAGEDARIECGEVNKALGKWALIETQIFKEKPSTTEIWDRKVTQATISKHFNGITHTPRNLL